ncbi:hypothetical protein [Desulfitobacterium dehalogenans]|uniref:hypothetical protein n=1 Tax=Desulfitobacterium dehalogenans TaxID=36854 RepID=UPI001FA81428|nr:hypothetical protein [Desulfitobacterium dehalogenans]
MSHYAEIQGDCDSPDALKKAIELTCPDMIIHMIAMYQSHIEALEKALEGQRIKLLLISSVDVYKGFEVFNKLSSAPIEPIPFTEKSPLRDIRFPYREKPGINFGYYYDKILVEEIACGRRQSIDFPNCGDTHGAANHKKSAGSCVKSSKCKKVCQWY